MIVGSIHENLNQEKRVAMTPDVVKKYISLGIKVNLTKNYASHLGIIDDLYIEQGVEIDQNISNVYGSAEIIVQLSLPSNENLSQLSENQCLIGVLDPYTNKDKINA